MSRFEFSLATPDDDAQLRMRTTRDHIEGAAAISLRREPSYFAACQLQGNPVQVIIARETVSGDIVLMGNRCMATSFIDGHPQRTALLADLRIDPQYRNGFLLARLFRFVRELHEADPLPCYSLIYDDNEVALRSLIGGRAGLPLFQPRGRLLASALQLGKRRPALTLDGVELRRAHSSELSEIIHFINRQRAAYQWAPVLHIDDFLPTGRCATLHAHDFFVAIRHGRLCATMATWDQSSLRQVHLERYASSTAMAKPFYNLLARLCGRPRLPASGQALSFVYLACIAVEDNDLALCGALLRHVYNNLCDGHWLYMLATLHEGDALSPVFANYHAAKSAVRLYEVDFDAAPEEYRAKSVCTIPRIEFALT